MSRGEPLDRPGEPTDRDPRLPIRLNTSLRCGTSEYTGITRNVSTGGMSIRLFSPSLTTQPLSVGAEVGFRLLVAEDEAIDGAGRVVWVRAPPAYQKGSSAEVGVELGEMSSAARSRLSAVLASFRYTVVVADEDPEYAPMYQRLSERYRVLRCSAAEAVLEALESEEVAALLVSEALGQQSGLELLQKTSSLDSARHCARILLSEFTVAWQMQQLINAGQLFACLRRPFSQPYLEAMIRRAVDAYTLATENERLTAELARAKDLLQRENRYLRQRLSGFDGADRIIGHSPQLRQALDELVRVRRTDATVHLTGETGTGKELFARALHEGGPRARGPFVAYNCSGISETLLESTLFGHKKGAFTGAVSDHPGLFRQAHGGTLFLDEVAELSPRMQAALLRAVQEGEITPLGADAPVKVDVRIVSATRADLAEEVKAGRFRADLLYRLMVVTIYLPPLRERTGDIPLLAMHFLDLHCEAKRKNVRGFSEEAMRALESYSWPGNVRELENEVERLVVLAEENEKVPLELLSPHIRGEVAEPPEPRPTSVDGFVCPDGVTYDEAVEQLSRWLVERALEQSGGVVSRAARLLAMDRTRLVKLRARLGLAPEKG